MIFKLFNDFFNSLFGTNRKSILINVKARR
jgi:hypothetical protein